jgi:hypothetical protein
MFTIVLFIIFALAVVSLVAPPGSTARTVIRNMIVTALVAAAVTMYAGGRAASSK